MINANIDTRVCVQLWKIESNSHKICPSKARYPNFRGGVHAESRPGVQGGVTTALPRRWENSQGC